MEATQYKTFPPVTKFYPSIIILSAYNILYRHSLNDSDDDDINQAFLTKPALALIGIGLDRNDGAVGS